MDTNNAFTNGVIFVGATNLPNKLDNAILRPGWLDIHIHIGLPD